MHILKSGQKSKWPNIVVWSVVLQSGTWLGHFQGGGIDLKCADKIPKLPTNIEKMTTKKNYFVINLNGLCVYVSVCMCVRLCLTFSVSAKSSYTFEARVTTDASKYFLGLRQGSLSIWF